MAIVTGFPFVLPNYVTLTVSMPYVDHRDGQVYYQSLNDVFLDDTVGHTDYEAVLLKWAWLNKSNIDWIVPVGALNLPSVNLTGEGVIHVPQVLGVHVTITAGANLADKWWNSTQIGRFGVIFPCNGPLPKPGLFMPPHYVNSPDSYITFSSADTTSPVNFVYYNIPPGMTATIICEQNPNIQVDPTIQSNVPPIYYVVPGGYSTLTPFDAHNAAPSGNTPVYGP
jgi:hypothetical protein